MTEIGVHVVKFIKKFLKTHPCIYRVYLEYLYMCMCICTIYIMYIHMYIYIYIVTDFILNGIMLVCWNWHYFI